MIADRIAAVAIVAAAAVVWASAWAAPTNDVITVTLPGGRDCTMKRPADGRPVTFFAHGLVYTVYHDGSYTNVTDKFRAAAEGRPAVFQGR